MLLSVSLLRKKLGLRSSQSVFATPLLLPTPPSPLFQVTGKPKHRVSIDECSFCHQKGHWKHACPKLLQPKGRLSGPPSSKPTSSGSRSSAAFFAPVSENGPSSNMQSMFKQFKSFMVTNANLSSQASAMTTTQLGLSGSSSSVLCKIEYPRGRLELDVELENYIYPGQLACSSKSVFYCIVFFLFKQ
ncbi:uncharacterized protein LOC114322890 [Camellia sinensis]|uniref:uncharacterized protein LOC114322890 n=1 Tax=Camellia sinensis TaxID=4442 RepID=UPI001036507C|nr:uncharacterized protein LOC114322890 [Camellia sinensis]